LSNARISLSIKGTPLPIYSFKRKTTSVFLTHQSAVLKSVNITLSFITCCETSHLKFFLRISEPVSLLGPFFAEGRGRERESSQLWIAEQSIHDETEATLLESPKELAAD